MKHVMVDIETLGTTPGSVIMSIGAVAFDPLGDLVKYELADPHVLGEGRFYCNVDIVNNLPGFHIEPGAVLWWFKQHREIREAVVEPPLYRIDYRLNQFSRWLNEIRHTNHESELRVWSHGKSFDLPLLEYAYKTCDIRVPWHFRELRDTRTIYELAVMGSIETKHHALADAVIQANAVQRAYRKLFGVEPVGKTGSDPVARGADARPEPEDGGRV